MDITWRLEERLIKNLKKNPRNPRSLSKTQYNQLNDSIEKFGLIDKPIITKDGMIIGGHQRIEVLKKSAVKTVECWVPDKLLTDKEVDELCIRLNRNHGSFDFDILANEFELVDLMEWGFNAEELVEDTITHIAEKEEKEKANKQKECPNCGHQF